MLKKKIPYLILLFIGLLGIKNLLHSGFWTSHDGRHQIIRLMHFHQGLKDGQLPPRWAGTAYRGYGYPLFIFTYRFPFWLAEGWYLISHNLGAAIKFVFIITYVLSGFSMYCFSRKLWRSRSAALLSSVLYLWAPYRFSNIFVRASLGEAVTFAFMPLIFLGILKLSLSKKETNQGSLLLLLAVSGSILSHAMAFGLWLAPLLGWSGWHFFKSRQKKTYFLRLFAAGILSLCLTAYYWLPAMAERKYVKFSGAISNYYQAHFVTLKQLFYSPWGYGFSMPGTENDLMSFQIGLAQWLAVFSGIIFVFFNWKKERSKNYLIFFLGSFFFSLYLMLESSAWFYPLLNKYFTIDIPWRFLGVAVFSGSLLFGGLNTYIKKKLLRDFLLVFGLFLAFYSNRNHLKVNQYVYFPESEYWQSAETSNEYDDYAPRWFRYEQAGQSDPDFTVLNGLAENKLVLRKSNLLKFQSQVQSESAFIAAKIAYYPGWQAFVDGSESEIYYEDDGRIKIGLDKGSHLVELVFKETRLRRISSLISLTALILLAGGLLVLKLKKGLTTKHCK